MSFTFLHAADLHLGSPFLGLTLKDEDVAKRFAAASREAFSNLVTHAIELKVAFVVIAGDVYDGEWKDTSIGLFFNRELSRLDRAKIPVFLVKGNHDAESVVTKTISLPDSVRQFPSNKATTHRIDELKVAVHGRSFPDRAVPENYALTYPDPDAGWFNIGVLHTSCDGRPPHAVYAPCTADDLARRGYQYWALGHAHEYEEVSRDPWIVFPGNLQGRHVRECGPKGAVLVEVADGHVRSVERLILDRARWANVGIDLSGIDNENTALRTIEDAIRPAADQADGRLLAVRVRLEGTTQLHRRLNADLRRFADEVQAAAQRCHEDVWLERLRVETRDVEKPSGVDASLLPIDLAAALNEIEKEPGARSAAADLVATIAGKLPAGIATDEKALDQDLDALLAAARDTVLGRILGQKRRCIMKIINLNLDRYGPFTGQTLAFKPDAKLHIVYGRNEAGKSCSLAAITDLFFGIDPRTRYDFLHEGKELRIGATIETHDGNRLSFQRRKGNKNTLLNPAGSALNDDALLPFLGSLTRGVFSHAFGLDTETLRAGAEEMLKSDGEVGASLFAAASGLRGLADARRALEAEADEIFGKRATKDRTFYQALERFETARKAMRTLELRAGDWKARNELIEELGTKLAQIKDERAQKTVEQARLLRLKRVAPLLRLVDRDIEIQRSLGDLPELPAKFTEHLRDGLAALAKATDDNARASAEHDQAKRELAEITVDEALIAKAGDVERLFGETVAYANNRRDMPRIQGEADEYSATLSQLAVRLGLPDAAIVEERLPPDAAQALARSLIAEGKALKQALDTHSRNLQSEIDALANLEQQRTERGAPIDPRPLCEKFAAFSPVLGQMEKCNETERTLTAEIEASTEAAARASIRRCLISIYSSKPLYLRLILSVVFADNLTA